MSKFMILLILLGLMSFKSISQHVILQRDQAVSNITDLEEYDWLREVLVPVYLERIEILEAVVNKDKVIIEQLKASNASLLEADRIRKLEVNAHREIEKELRKENKKLRRKLVVNKVASGLLIAGVGALIIVNR